MDLNLFTKNALVCGGSKGIGKAIATELALLGANIILAARNEELLQKTIAELDTSLGQTHQYLVADVSQLEDWKEKVEVLAATQTIHILVNNTGGPPSGTIVGADISAFAIAFQNHLLANHVASVAVVEGMKKTRFGRIINVISTSVKQPLEGLGVSNTIRAAVANWSKTLATELAPFGITVNNLLPGATQTERLESIISTKSSKQQVAVKDVEDEMLAEIPMRRFGQPHEIAAAAAFLASPAAAYITGINLTVDGGRTKSL